MHPPDSARIPGAPYGYRVRYALSHHLGGWKPCKGAPKCEHCAGAERLKASKARRGEGATEKAGGRRHAT
jgi:hypothetical protein